MVYSIEKPEHFEVHGGSTEDACYGCDQEWYNSEWQRISGCGPTAASNLIYYITKARPQACTLNIKNNRESCLALMGQVWSYVTPTEEGVDSTKRFAESLQVYFNAVGLRAEPAVCDIPEDRAARPTFAAVLDFLAAALGSDAPVAFLNLCNGEETNLEAWHWVTVIALETGGDRENAYLTIIDGSQTKRIDMKLWYETTTLGGGFVWFKTAEQ